MHGSRGEVDGSRRRRGAGADVEAAGPRACRDSPATRAARSEAAGDGLGGGGRLGRGGGGGEAVAGGAAPAVGGEGRPAADPGPAGPWGRLREKEALPKLHVKCLSATIAFSFDSSIQIPQ